MYGGYGNLWNQGGNQWPTQLQNQNQTQQQQNQQGFANVTQQQQAYQQAQQQQMLAAYGGASNAAVAAMGTAANSGMMNYMNNGMGAYMNYASSGYMNAANNAWMTGQMSIQQQAAAYSQARTGFPGGRPPLPPGPPPPDPNDAKAQISAAVNKVFPLQPSASTLRPAAPAPPPPPPPPPQQSADNSVLTAINSFNSMKPEEALNILKNAAALGMIPKSGPLAPLTSLNVSEELFGSKKDSKGIPGLDFTEDQEQEKAKTPSPELVDLEASEPGTDALKDTAKIVTQPTNKVEKTAEEKKELIWELRPDVPGSSNNDKFGNLQGTQRKDTSTPASSAPSKSTDLGMGTSNGKDSYDESSRSSCGETKTECRPVQIPLDPADGTQLIYDRRTLKQFDIRFREWEGQFETWKRDNEKHPDKVAYNKFMETWDSWRQQLVDQRRSILDKMSKARLDSKEIILAKLGAKDTDENKSTPSINTQYPGINQAKTENPFAAALRNSDMERKAPPPPPPPTQSTGNEPKSNISGIPPLFPCVAGNKVLLPLPTPQNERDRPVEKILRSGRERNDVNIFNTEFTQNKPSVNPFDTSQPSFSNEMSERGRINLHSQQRPQGDNKESNSDSPYEWSLSSNNKSDNPFNVAAQSNNPFMQPSGPNPFNMKPQQTLPSLQDFISRTSLDFSPSKMQSSGSNSFAPNLPSSGERRNLFAHDAKVERILRDPNKPIEVADKRLEPNPVGMPLLIAAKEATPPPRSEMDAISHLFSRDRGDSNEFPNDNSNFQVDDDEDFCEAEVIDYGAANSVDSMDFPRGENPDAEVEEDDDLNLEDAEVVDYSHTTAVPLHGDGYQRFGQWDDPNVQGYPNEFDPGYPHGPGGRGFPPGARGRGAYRGHPGFGRGGIPPPAMDPQYQNYGPPPTRGMPFQGMAPGPGRGYPPPSNYHYDNIPIQHPIHQQPEVVELSPSPEPPTAPIPGVKIAPPNPEFEMSRNDRKRPRDVNERSRSRSRDRVRRYDGSPQDRRRRDNSPHSSRRDRDRDRKNSPERRGRFDERNDRDRHHRRGRSRSKSPGESQPLVRNPLFPSAAGMHGSHFASNPPPPRYQTVLIEDILNTPGRSKRPQRLVIIMRGLPGSGKSHIVKLIKEREILMGGKAPRILSIDNYFMTEMEKREKDPVTGVEVKKTVMEYEFDEDREPEYRAQLVKQFKKTLDEGYFSFVIVDCVNEYIKQFEEMASFATSKYFQVYVAEIEESVEVCAGRNLQKRSKDQLLRISRHWERTPGNLIKLDTRTLLQDESVQDVEMEDVSDVETDNIEKAPTPIERGKIGPQVIDLEDIEDDDSGDHLLVSATSSKWDTIEPSTEKLNKLDGLVKKRRTSENADVEGGQSIENWLKDHNPDDFVVRKETQPGQKRVRWADIEERREQEKMREMGFVVGHTDWKRMMDPSFGSSALTKTKFI